MIEKDIICVICPQSCHINVKGDGKEITEMTGYTCKRGIEYATNEYTNPKRTLTSVVKAEGYTCPVIAVRSNKPIPKDMVFDAMDEVRQAVAKPPFYIGKVIIENILGTGADIVLSNK